MLLIIHELKEPSWGHPWIKRMIGFVSCFIYFAMLAALWGIICLLLGIHDVVNAIGTLALAGVVFLIVLFG